MKRSGSNATDFDPVFAAEIWRSPDDGMRAISRWRWHSDEMFVNVNDERH